MRILIVNPNTSTEMTAKIEAVARAYARPDTVLEAANPAFGPRVIEGFFEEDVARHAMLETILDRRGQYDGIVIAAFCNPGIWAAREIVSVPVIGIAEAAFHFATLLGRKFSILGHLPRLHGMMEEYARFFGFGHALASVRTIEFPVTEIGPEAEEAIVRIVKVGKQAVREDGAEVLCLGCAGMALLDKTVETQVGVPVLDGTVCAVKLLEGMADYGVKTSKVSTFAFPEPGKEWVGMSDLFDVL